jgi:hypothetical protein
MLSTSVSRRAGVALTVVAMLQVAGASGSEKNAGSVRASADRVPASADRVPASVDRRAADYRPPAARLEAVSPDHPLLPALKEARQWLGQARQKVHDFHCRVTKRERIDGLLQEFYYIEMWVREEVRVAEQVRSPFSVYMEFLGPKSVYDRRLLYVEGRNEGKIMVRKGGPRFEYVVTEVDADAESTKSESLCPITQSGFIPLLAEIVATMERHMIADPTGENTVVTHPQGAKVDGRPCHVVRIMHPEKQDGLDFHVGTYFIDAGMGVPARIEKLDWPRKPDAAPGLIAEYNYTKVQINLGLSDSTFDPKRLRAKK